MYPALAFRAVQWRGGALDRRVIVTGGSRGLGLAIAGHLTSNGWQVGILARDEAGLSEAVRSRAAVTSVAVDLTDSTAAGLAIDQLAADLGGVDALVNNAGKVLRSRFEKLDPAQFRSVIEQNLFCAVHATHAAIPHLKQSGGGSVVNISSISGIQPLPGGSAYAAAKHGLVGWSRSIFHEFRGEGIRVSLVHPGSIEAQESSGVPAEEVARAVAAILEAPPGTVISELEVRPLKPPRA